MQEKYIKRCGWIGNLEKLFSLENKVKKNYVKKLIKNIKLFKELKSIKILWKNIKIMKIIENILKRKV